MFLFYHVIMADCSNMTSFLTCSLIVNEVGRLKYWTHIVCGTVAMATVLLLKWHKLREFQNPICDNVSFQTRVLEHYWVHQLFMFDQSDSDQLSNLLISVSLVQEKSFAIFSRRLSFWNSEMFYVDDFADISLIVCVRPWSLSLSTLVWQADR